jgi:protein-S-isoprenylcysteine O-methyltransferase Ste14
LGTEWRGAPEVRDDMKLITSGPYGITRHPIYTSLFMMMFGSALTTLFWVSFLEFFVVVIAYTVKAVAEEKMLAIHFGKQYAKYQKTVWMLIPYLY